MIRFALFSTDAIATPNPWDVDPAPATFIDFGEEPLFGDYNPNAGSSGRGARIQTLGGAVDQDFGSFEEDGRITLGLNSVRLSESTVTALLAAYAATDQQYYWTDSISCWLVKFVKPDGLRVGRVLFYKAVANEDIFNVELALKVVSKEI